MREAAAASLKKVALAAGEADSTTAGAGLSGRLGWRTIHQVSSARVAMVPTMPAPMSKRVLWRLADLRRLVPPGMPRRVAEPARRRLSESFKCASISS